MYSSMVSFEQQGIKKEWTAIEVITIIEYNIE